MTHLNGTVKTEEAEPDPIKCLEYNYCTYGEDYYYINWYDESQPLNMRREPVEYPEFRRLRAALAQIPHTTVYHDSGAFYTYDIDAQVELLEQAEIDRHYYAEQMGAGRV